MCWLHQWDYLSLQDSPEWSSNLPAVICPPEVDVVRFSFNLPQPKSLLFKNLIVSGPDGTSVVPWREKMDTYGEGWMLQLISGQDYTLQFENADQIHNFSYAGKFYGMEVGNISHVSFVFCKVIIISPGRDTCHFTSIAMRWTYCFPLIAFRYLSQIFTDDSPQSKVGWDCISA